MIQDVLNICKYIYNNDRIEQLKLKLNEGKSLDEAILECDFNKTFKEYFNFFELKIIYLKQLYKVLIFVNQKILPL